jgi:hypothetical protein
MTFERYLVCLSGVVLKIGAGYRRNLWEDGEFFLVEAEL